MSPDPTAHLTLPDVSESQTRVVVYLSGEWDNEEHVAAGTPRENADRLRERGWVEIYATSLEVSLICPGTNLRVTLEPHWWEE